MEFIFVARNNYNFTTNKTTTKINAINDNLWTALVFLLALLVACKTFSKINFAGITSFSFSTLPKSKLMLFLIC